MQTYRVALALFTVLAAAGCASGSSRSGLCGNATADHFVPVNEWMPISERDSSGRAQTSIRNTRGRDPFSYASACSQLAYDASYTSRSRLIYATSSWVYSLRGSNLCAGTPRIDVWHPHTGTREDAYRDFFSESQSRWEEDLRLVVETIQVQCRSLPERVELSYIARADLPHSSLDRAAMRNRRKPGGRDVPYVSLYEGTLYPKRLVRGTGLTDSTGVTTETTSLRDLDPSLRQRERTRAAMRSARSDARRLAKRDQRERELQEVFGPVLAFSAATIQSFALEFADEGACYFLASRRSSFRREDYDRCAKHLHASQRALREDFPVSYALGQLIAAMRDNRRRLKTEENGSLTRRSGDMMGECAKAVLTRLGAAAPGEVVEARELERVCAAAAAMARTR